MTSTYCIPKYFWHFSATKQLMTLNRKKCVKMQCWWTKASAARAHLPKHTPQYRRAALSSCVGCLTAHPSPPGTDHQELKRVMEKTAQLYFHMHTAHISIPTQKIEGSPIQSGTHKFLRSLYVKMGNGNRFILLLLLIQLSDRAAAALTVSPHSAEATHVESVHVRLN